MRQLPLRRDQGLLIARRRAIDRLMIAMMLALAGWMLGSGVLRYREAGLTDAAEAALREAERLRAEVGDLRAELAAVAQARSAVVVAAAPAPEPRPTASGSVVQPAEGSDSPRVGHVDTGASRRGLLLRAAPGGAVISQLAQGATLEVSNAAQAQGLDWLKVRSSDGREGWVSARNVKFDTPSSGN